MSLLALGLILFVLGLIFAIKVLYIIGIVLLVVAAAVYIAAELPSRRR